MISRNRIKKQLEYLKITDYTKNYWYCYAITLNGMAVAKPGRSSVNLLDRIYQYINVEHSNQKIENFFLIAVIEFDRKKSLIAAENFIKENTDRRFNVFKNQPSQLEQYQLKPFFDEINKHFINFPFSTKSYLREDKYVTRIVNYILSKHETPYLSLEYESLEKPLEQKEITKVMIPKTTFSGKSNTKVNINTATVRDLLTKLSHCKTGRGRALGDTLAARVVEYRETHGKYTHIREILNVPMIGTKTFEALRNDICV